MTYRGEYKAYKLTNNSFKRVTVFPADFHIRPLTPEDLDQIMVNEKLTYTFAWSRSHFEDCLNAGYSAFVIETKQQMIGHAVISFAADECHILNISIIPSEQKKGWGKCLLKELLSVAEQKQTALVFLEVRPSNTPGLALYQSAGFIEVGRRKHYYPSKSGREDALVLRKVLNLNAYPKDMLST